MKAERKFLRGTGGSNEQVGPSGGCAVVAVLGQLKRCGERGFGWVRCSVGIRWLHRGSAERLWRSSWWGPAGCSCSPPVTATGDGRSWTENLALVCVFKAYRGDEPLALKAEGGPHTHPHVGRAVVLRQIHGSSSVNLDECGCDFVEIVVT